MDKEPNLQKNNLKKLKDGITELADAYNAWSAGLGTYSVQSV
jgi:X-X-X-Leu-X-X-Gly heptad repeat protein